LFVLKYFATLGKTNNSGIIESSAVVSRLLAFFGMPREVLEL